MYKPTYTSVFLLFLALTFCTLSAQGARKRKKVAVVLAGGGAKGMAHVGALKVIERAGIPVDIVTGTSMGSIIGGLYSIGYTPEQMDSIVREQDWQYLLSDEELTEKQSLEAREKDGTYVLNLGLSLGNTKKGSKAGLIEGRNISSLLRNLTVGYTDSIGFNQLPRRFACVATDIVTNQEYDFHSGVLADAMRASMSIPAAFVPVRKDSMVLVDGGMSNNYPADVARKMGADIIIGVTVQEADKTADELGSTMAILSQIVDINCKNKYEENLAITDIAIRVNPEPYGTTSFTPEAIDSLMLKGEEEAMKHWDELVRLHKQLGSPADISVTKSPEPISSDTKFRVDSFVFRNMTAHDERVIRARFHLKRRDSLTVREAELIATTMRTDLFFDKADYRIEEKHGVHTAIFNAGSRKTAQANFGMRFDNEEMAALQLNAEVPFHAHTPLNLDLTVRLGKRIKGRSEAVFHPTSISKMRLAYEYNYNDINIYDRGDRRFNTTFDQHSIQLTLYELNLRNFNMTVGARWEYNDYNRILKDADTENDFSHLQHERFYVYEAALQYNSENDWELPTRGSRLTARYGYHTDNGAAYRGHTGYSTAEASWRSNLPIGERFALQPMLYGRLLFGRDIPMISRNLIGGNRFGHYFQQQMPFAGMGYAEFTSDQFVAVQLKSQAQLLKSLYLIGRASYAKHHDMLKHLHEGHNLWGAQIEACHKTFIGPIRAGIGWNNKAEKAYMYVSFGHDF